MTPDCSLCLAPTQGKRFSTSVFSSNFTGERFELSEGDTSQVYPCFFAASSFCYPSILVLTKSIILANRKVVPKVRLFQVRGDLVQLRHQHQKPVVSTKEIKNSLIFIAYNYDLWVSYWASFQHFENKLVVQWRHVLWFISKNDVVTKRLPRLQVCEAYITQLNVVLTNASIVLHSHCVLVVDLYHTTSPHFLPTERQKKTISNK